MTATQAQSAQAIATFVSNFHHDLTRWFSGADEGEATWNALVNACPDNMTLIYPCGAQLSGRAFLEELASSKRHNGDFVASASEISCGGPSPSSQAFEREVRPACAASPRVSGRRLGGLSAS